MDEKRFDSDNRFEDYQAYENLVKETVDYESLEVTHHDDMRQVDEARYFRGQSKNKKWGKTAVFFHSLHSSGSNFYYYYRNTLE